MPCTVVVAVADVPWAPIETLVAFMLEEDDIDDQGMFEDAERTEIFQSVLAHENSSETFDSEFEVIDVSSTGLASEGLVLLTKQTREK